MRRFAGLTLLAFLAALIAVTPGAGVAAGGSRPDLSVSKSSVGAAGGTISGTFFVKNKGNARAGRSRAVLYVEKPGKDAVAERFRVGEVGPSNTYQLDVSVPVPSGLPDGALPITACADTRDEIRERKEGNNCGTVGAVQVGEGGSSVPTDPISFEKEKVFTLDSSASRFWVFVPRSYDETHQTPTKLLVWMHGCGGLASGDIFTVSPGGDSQDWISIAIGGREGGCWDNVADQPKIFEAIAAMKTHFNLNSRKVVLGGYSSGGDIAYRTAFYNANAFAGVLAMNTSPFRDTGSTQQDSLAAAAWKFNVVHVAHLQDSTYPIAGVRSETEAMKAAGFPITRIDVDGEHYNDPGDNVNGQPVPGTDADIQNLLLPHIEDGWTAP